MSVQQSLPRLSLRTTLAAAFAVVFLVLPLQGQRAELEKRIKRQVLPNGLEVIVVENHGVPLATVEADARNGSFTQSATYEGLSHLYAHMFFKANALFPQPDAFVNRASEIGAVFNGTTNEEQVNYYLTVPSDSTNAAMELLASALRAPLFLKDELERERAVVIGEYDRAESDPGHALQTAMWSRKGCPVATSARPEPFSNTHRIVVSLVSRVTTVMTYRFPRAASTLPKAPTSSSSARARPESFRTEVVVMRRLVDSSTVAISISPLTRSVEPVETRSTMTSAMPMCGAISAAPDTGTTSAESRC